MKAGLLSHLASFLTPDTSGNIVHSNPPAQFDSTGKLATTGFVQRALGNIGGTLAYNVNTTLTAAQVGQFINLYGTNTVLTLPAISAVPVGATFVIWCSSGVNCSLAAQGTDNIYLSASPATSAAMSAGDFVTLVAQPGVGGSGSGWTVMNGSIALKNTPAFAAARAVNGYQKLPGGLIIQWGQMTSGGGGLVQAAFPITFPTGCLVAQCNYLLGGNSTNGVAQVSSNTTNAIIQGNVFTSSTGTGFTGGVIYWIAIGY